MLSQYLKNSNYYFIITSIYLSALLQFFIINFNYYNKFLKMFNDFINCWITAKTYGAQKKHKQLGNKNNEDSQ